MERQINKLIKISLLIRKKIFQTAIEAGSGHMASCFSCVDILVAIYYSGVFRVNLKYRNQITRDRFLLSKGHAALVLYAILADCGFFCSNKLRRFIKDGSSIGVHPDYGVPGVEFSSGSLGHSLSVAAGMALAAKKDGKGYLCIVLLGDGECHEGSVWEAAMFAAYQRLNNLIVIIDYNGLSATDFLKRYLDISPLGRKWESFGWDTIAVNGHSFSELILAFKGLRERRSANPLAIIAVTTKGKGVSFMENSPIWHYRIPVGKELRIARQELDLGNSHERI